MLLDCLAVGAGGFVGAVARYLCGLAAPQAAFPYATLAINVCGSFALAAFAALVLGGAIADERLSLFLRVGLCGGFTTFSTFSVEAMQLAQQGRPGWAVAYAALSCALCIGAAFAGDWLVASCQRG